MGHTHDIGQLQDYFYAVMCTASHAALRAEANRRHKALLRVKERQEQAEKRKKSLEDARARAEAAREREAAGGDAAAASAEDSAGAEAAGADTGAEVGTAATLDAAMQVESESNESKA